MTKSAQTLKLADFLEQYQDEIVKSVVRTSIGTVKNEAILG